MAKLDLVIIVDSSASVGGPNFKEIVKFILDLLKPLPVHSDGIRVALVRYSSDASVISYLSDDMTKTQKAAALGKMKYMPGSTKTDLAIALTRDQVLIPEKGDRPDVPDQVILLTDGTSTNRQGTRNEIRKLKMRTALKIIVLGIGNTLDDAELLEIATSPELKHVVTNFSHLSGLLKDLESATCEERPKIVIRAPVIEVLTTPEEVSVVQINHVSSENSFHDNYSLYPPSCVNESVYPSQASLNQQFDTTISYVHKFDTISDDESYSISESGYYKSSSVDLIYPSGSLSYKPTLISVTPSFYIYSPESSMSYRINKSPSSSESVQETLLNTETSHIFPSSSESVQEILLNTETSHIFPSSSESLQESLLNMETSHISPSSSESVQESLLNIETSINPTSRSQYLQESFFIFETSSPSHVTTTDLDDDMITSAEPTDILSSTQFSSGASIKDSYYDNDVPISSFSPTKGSDSVHLADSMTSLPQISTGASVKDPQYDYDVSISSVTDYRILSTHSNLGSDSVQLLEIMTSLPQISTGASVKDPQYDYDVPISSVTDYRILSTHSTFGSDSVHLLETMTSSTSTPPLLPMLLSMLITTSDPFLDSVTSSSPIVTTAMNSSPTESIMPTSTSLYSLDYLMSDSLPSSPVSRSVNDSFSSVFLATISPTFTTENTQSQSHLSNTGSAKTVLVTENNVFDNISINSSSVETQNSKTGGDISPDLVYTFVGGGIVGLVTLLASGIILARIFRRRNEEEEIRT